MSSSPFSFVCLKLVTGILLICIHCLILQFLIIVGNSKRDCDEYIYIYIYRKYKKLHFGSPKRDELLIFSHWFHSFTFFKSIRHLLITLPPPSPGIYVVANLKSFVRISPSVPIARNCILPQFLKWFVKAKIRIFITFCSLINFFYRFVPRWHKAST